MGLIYAVINIAVLVALGVLTSGWLLRVFGACCMLVGAFFTVMFLMMGTSSPAQEYANYWVFAMLMIFGAAFWLGGHRMYVWRRGVWRSDRGKQWYLAYLAWVDLSRTIWERLTGPRQQEHQAGQAESTQPAQHPQQG